MSAAVAAAMAFNLVCSGQAWTSYGIFKPPENRHDFEITYHIDLSVNRYCIDKCTTTIPLKQVTENKIIFEMEERAILDDTITYVNRENGNYFDRTRRYLSGDSVLVTVSEGKCQKAPFTGLPTRKF